MSEEHLVNLKSSMQDLSTRLPIIALQRVEEQMSPVREVTVGAVGLCGDKIIITSYFRNLCGLKKIFSCNLVLPFTFCGLKF